MIATDGFERMSMEQLEKAAGVDGSMRRIAILFGEAFYEGREDVLQSPGDDPIRNRTRAMLTLLAFSSQLLKRELPLFGARVSCGSLKLPCGETSETIHTGYCYDGGCYSEECESRYFRCFMKIETLSPRSSELAELASRGDAGSGVFPLGGGKYILRDCMGLRGSYQIRYYKEEYDGRP